MVATSLAILPSRQGCAAENMASDFLLLHHYPQPEVVRFRHYGWHRPAYTFGYSQPIEFVRNQLPRDEIIDLCRRPTGGGIVDHRDDWTYALVIPRGHPAEELRAIQSYRLVHEAMVTALGKQQVLSSLQVSTPNKPLEEWIAPAGICFERAEIFDVIQPTTGKKIAGAAQKRSKRGLLFQGSVCRKTVIKEAPPSFDWDQFHADFTWELGVGLHLSPLQQPWPELDDGEIADLTEKYASNEWLECR